MYGLSDGHSGTGNDVYIGHAAYPAAINAGSHATAYGMLKNGSGTTHVVATSTGVASTGFVASAGTVNFTGSCVGSNTASGGAGCNGGSSTVTFNFTGKDIAGTHSTGIIGKVLYTPAATDYVLRAKDASYTRGTVDEHAVEMPTDPGAANVETGTAYGSFTGTLDVSGSGSSPYAY